MTKRKAISKKVRFEVFKRDAFTCQYCGRKSPDVVLEVDHIEPVAEGGENDILNYVAACHDCNIGKGRRKLSDNSTVEKQREQLKLLQERKEQIEMMMKWKLELLTLDETVTENLTAYFNKLIEPRFLTETGTAKIRLLQKRFSMQEILEGMNTSAQSYQRLNNPEWANIALDKLGGVCANQRKFKNDPIEKEIFEIRWILQKNCGYINVRTFYILVKQAIKLGATTESLKRHAESVKNWTQWRESLERTNLEHQCHPVEVSDGND